MTELEASHPGEHPPPYIIFVVVFFFFLTGLFGFLICHLLKKKGYRCRTGDMSDDEEEEKIRGNAGDEDEQNQDTVEEILKCIIANEANMEAFNEMIGNRNVCVRHDPRLRKGSIGGLPPHLHTVHSGTDHNSCLLCAQVRSKKGRRQSRTPRFKQRPGEQTVFSVGRFRVTHHDKKLHGGPNALVSSGDQLDQSQDSDDRKESGYNLRNMFKEVGPTTESSNGLAPAVGKRKKSLTIFGLRRGSDPTGIRGGEGTGRETGGVRFAIQQQPVVPEEVSLTENVEVGPGVKPQTQPLKNQMDQGIHSANSPSSEAKTGREDSTGAPKVGSESPVKQRTSVPGYLPVPSPASSEQTFKSREKQGGAEGEVLKSEEDDDSGPLQTSTPIVPLHGSVPGSASVLPAGQTHLNTDFPVTQTPPDASSSPDGKPGYGTDLALISLGSSPPSLLQNKTPSSVSSLKTPTSPLAVTLSPKLRSVNTPSEASQTGFSPILTPSPKLQSDRVIPLSSFGRSSSPLQAQTPSPTPTASIMTASSQTASLPPADPNLSTEASPCLTLTLKSENVTSVKAVAEGGILPSLLSVKEHKLEGAGIMKAKAQSAEVLQTAKLSQGVAFSAAGQPGSSLPVTPFSPLSPSSPLGSRVSDVTIVKASPDSKREFAVVTMVDEEESSSSVKDQERKALKPLSEPENVGSVSAVGVAKIDPVAGVGQQGSQCGGTSGVEDGLNASEKKHDAGVSKETAVKETERADEEKENI
ncbi:uncharacterized protein V6R79_004098 [Siganus canaliculatus]